jgi:hypothetical protein
MKTPMVIHIYGPDDEVLQTFTRTFVPWRLLKLAVRLNQTLDPKNMTEADMDALTGLVVAVFGDRFTVEELNNGADTGEMVAVINQIVAVANGGMMGNPTPPPGS